MNRDELVSYLDDYLRINEIEDYGPQGLQVDSGKSNVNRLALAVDTAPAVIQEAATWRADMLLVHHGILWRNVEPISGALGRRVRALIQNGIDLYGAHLPLDAHPDVGNNIILARAFALNVEGWWCAQMGTPLGVYGSLSVEIPLDTFVQSVEHYLKSSTRVSASGPSNVRKIAILSGFGADEVKEAKNVGADTYLTGEASHSHYWAAADHGLNVIYAGHYATETVGVKALGLHLANKFGLETNFIDFPTGL
jgi:dinuclear metal center YbgI/SA1388 family protein